jgi:hypothetical protein
MVPGFTTSQRTRPLVIAKMISYIHDKSVTIQSKRTMEELRTFVWKNGKAQAQDGYNDDLVMSLGIGLFLRDTSLKYKQTGDQLARVAVEGIGKINPSMINGNYNGLNTFNNPYQMNDNYGNAIDLNWLIK